MAGLKLITPPATEPITVADAEAQSRWDMADEAALVEGYIAAARQKAETYLRRPLITQTWELALDTFPGTLGAIKLPLPPLQSVTSITYIDTDGTLQTLDPALYKVDDSSEPARIVPAYGKTWPATRDEIAAVKVRFVCGYGDTAESVPMCVRQWLLLNVADYFENRETVQVGQRLAFVDAKTLADGLLDAVPGGRAFEW